MQPRHPIVPAIALLALILTVAGCASAPSPRPTDAATASESGATTTEASDAPMTAVGGDAAIRFHVDGPGTDEGSCAPSFSALHSPDLAPLELELEIEIYRVSDDIFVSSVPLPQSLPAMTALETVDGMESPIFDDNLLLPCDDLRAEIHVVSCDPSPCPSLGVQPGYNQIPLTVSGPDAS